MNSNAVPFGGVQNAAVRTDSCVKSDGGSSSGSKAGVPTDRAWSDYLTFRGVVVEKKSSFDISEIGKAWIAGGGATASDSDYALMSSPDLERAKLPAEQLSSPMEKSGLPVETNVNTEKTHYREMTPMKDIQGSERSSLWLEQELRRRAFVKQEINTAIKERGRKMNGIDAEEDSYKKRNMRRSLKEFDADEFSFHETKSNSELDEEVAAITADELQKKVMYHLVQSPSNGRIPGNCSMEDPPPRRLFGVDEQPGPKDSFAGFANSMESHDEDGQPLDFEDMQVEMREFASKTRAALRDQSFTEKVLAESSKFTPLTVLSPLSVDFSAEADDPNVASSHQQTKQVAMSKADNSTSNMGSERSKAASKTTNSGSISTDFVDLQPDEVPLLIRSIDFFSGIAKGDITLSLLSENTGSQETSVGATWANRVRGAIWRARQMRRNMSHEFHAQKSPTRGRSVEKARVAGSCRTIGSIQDAALLHMKHDELDEAIDLYEDIIFAYYSYFERSLDLREKNPRQENEIGPIDFQPYIGVALHNLGILHLLKGEYVEALSYFTRAVETRKAHLGEDHSDHIVSNL